MAKIFLTGHRGFIGGHLYRRLVDFHDVYTDPKFLDTMQFDCVIHLAGVTHIKTEFDPFLFEQNIVFAKKVLSTPFPTIYASSCSAAHLTNPYAYSKAYSEWLGEKHGRAHGLRFHNVYGPGNNKGIVWFLEHQKSGSRINLRGPNLIRDYIYVDDVVETIVWHLKHAIDYVKKRSFVSGVYDVGTGKGTRTIDLVTLYERVTGKSFNITVSDPGPNEPNHMVASSPTMSLNLEEGLKKLISLS